MNVPYPSLDAKTVLPGKFRTALLGIIILMIFIRLVDVLIYPHTDILPTDFFLAITIAQLFFLWLDGVKERERVLWVQKKKEELIDIKDNFTTLTSHELRTPITVIKMYMELISGGGLGELTVEQVEALATIDKYFKRLEELQASLAKIYSAGPPAYLHKMSLTSLSVIVKSAAGDMAPFVKKRKQSLVVEGSEDGIDVVMDPEGIKQVVVNLLLNAIRFTPDGGKITARVTDAGGIARVEVEDNGIGIPKDKLVSVFDSFYKAGELSHHSSGNIEFKSGGIGLGLTIAKKIVDAHKGSIWAESEEGKSSKFIFTLPKKD